MGNFLTDSYKKLQKNKREDWMWFEDPYKARSGELKSSATKVPAPNPTFGSGPTVH